MSKEFAHNRRAMFEYEFKEQFEAGLSITGFEVKAIKSGNVDISNAFVVPKGSELFLVGAHVAHYQATNAPKNFDATRARKLLMHKKEIARLIGAIKQHGLTVIPLRLYNKRGLIKLELALAKGRKKADKREAIKQREAKREIERLNHNFK